MVCGRALLNEAVDSGANECGAKDAATDDQTEFEAAHAGIELSAVLRGRIVVQSERHAVFVIVELNSKVFQELRSRNQSALS